MNMTLYKTFAFVLLLAGMCVSAQGASADSWQTNANAWSSSQFDLAGQPVTSPMYTSTNIFTNTDTSSTTNNTGTTQSAKKVVTTRTSTATSSTSHLSKNTAKITNGLTAMSIAGDDSFMPDTFFEWLMTIVFILILIIVIRLYFAPKPHHH